MATLRLRYEAGTSGPIWETIPAAEAPQMSERRDAGERAARAEAGSFRKVLSPWLIEE